MLELMNGWGRPEAVSRLSGAPGNESIEGIVEFYGVHGGTIVVVKVSGLPQGTDRAGFFGFHVHAGGACTGNGTDPFANAGMHYNPANTEHPRHAGDLPPLLADHGMAWMEVYTTRFHPEDVIGRTVIIHDMPDDFHTQPSGDSGKKIACGVIEAE